MRLWLILPLAACLVACNAPTEQPCTPTNPIADANPGNPENAVKDFKVIRSAMMKFHKAKGRFPNAEEMFDWSKDLLPGVRLNQADFVPEDVAFADGYIKGGTDRGVTYTIAVGQEWDGKSKQFLVSSDHYRRKHEVKCADSTNRYRWGGVVVTMWTDGSVSKTKPGDLYTFQLPGQGRLAFQEYSPSMPKGAQKMRDYDKSKAPTVQYE